MAKRRTRKPSNSEPRPPAGLTARSFHVGGAEMAILSFPVAGPQLTPTEHDIVAALLAGKRNADIARERGTALRTIANQIASIFRKLGVRSRAELIAHAAFLGGRPTDGGTR